MEQRLHQHAVNLIVRLLQDRTGQVLSEDRIWRVDRAIEAVLRKRGVKRSLDIIALLTHPDAAEVERELVEELLNNETYFFRDRQVFNVLATSVLPDLAKAKGASRQLNIWSAGCSTGQEPLSLAITLLEQGAQWKGWTIRIHATDVSHSAIDVAREATYSQFEIQRGLAVGQMLSHFEETERGWRANQDLRRMVHYETANLLEGPPAGMVFDLILCRNLLLYFDDSAKTVAGRHLASAMAPHARLLIGGGETVTDRSIGFASASTDCALYRLSPERATRNAA
jgi:chemotaxis protein methyltransferase CheR